MPTIKITVLPENKVIEVDPATMPYHEHGKKGSILDILMHHDVHLEHSCGGNCACTTCHVIMKAGEEHINEPEDDELDKLDKAPGLTLHSRLGCQVVPTGDITFEIPTWNINYVSEGGGSMNLGGAIPPPKK